MQRCAETSCSAGQPAHKNLKMAMGSVQAPSSAEQPADNFGAVVLNGLLADRGYDLVL